ncbi:hypothetical protein BO221_19960 [Archangium sp. Cb G35]|uniref:hypothetical protein n=1 Tax=Archangium sp. Cb G35 TaxID=1920190 RepID=UPI000935C416|nr:hypothetical protein [Archangium sp. Cb G35]OJT23150.1 hypothetical protein BO221_19960 [Archangium sp. Cb G35]
MGEQMLGGLVGKTYDAPEVQAFVAPLGKVDVDEEIGAPESVYYTFEKSGVTVLTDVRSKRVTHIILEAPQGKRGYRGPIPFGLSFDSSKEQIRQALKREPDRTKPFFDAWEMGEYVFHVAYKAGAIKSITFKVD